MHDECFEENEECLRLQREIDSKRFRMEILEASIKDAFATMMFSFQFFAQDREYYSCLRHRYEDLDRELAEIDGRLKRCKPKLEPHTRKGGRNSNIATKEKLKDILRKMTPENRELLFAQLRKEIDKNGEY